VRQSVRVSSNESLYAAIASNPEPMEGFRVLADALMEEGDPHGELIALACAQEASRDLRGFRERTSPYRRLLRALEPHLLEGVLREHFHLEWRRGFVDRARFETQSEDESVEQLRTFFRSVGGRFVRALDVTRFGVERTAPSSLLTFLGREALEQLGLGWNAAREAPAQKLERLGALMAKLHTLRLDSTGLSFSGKFPKLERLTVSWPALDDFALWLSSGPAPKLSWLSVTADLHRGDWLEYLDEGRFSRLSELELRATGDVTRTFAALAKTKVSQQLQRLSLQGAFTESTLTAITGAKPRFAKLRALLLHGRSEVTQKSLKAARKAWPALKATVERPMSLEDFR
jgi:hypothetical protein